MKFGVSPHPFEDTPQCKQQRAEGGRPGNGLGDVGSFDPVADDVHERRMINGVELGSVEEPSSVEEPGRTVEHPKVDVLPGLYELTPKQRFVLELRWGLRDDYVYTYGDIAKMMDVSFQAVQRIEERALDTLRRLEGRELDPVTSRPGVTEEDLATEEPAA